VSEIITGNVKVSKLTHGFVVVSQWFDEKLCYGEGLQMGLLIAINLNVFS